MGDEDLEMYGMRSMKRTETDRREVFELLASSTER
jgi:hypothetical protein